LYLGKCETPVYGHKVVETYKHDTSFFTQGLYYDGSTGHMYESSGGYGTSRIKRYDFKTGEVFQSYKLSDRSLFGEGLAECNGKLYQLTWQSGKIFQYDKANFDKGYEKEYATPSAEGWGLTYDGVHLIYSDGTANIYFLDPNTLQVAKKILVMKDGNPVTRLNELEYINGEIWSNIWYSQQIVRIDPNTGIVNSVMDFSNLKSPSGDVMNGIAYDIKTGRIWITGKLWPYLYEVQVLDGPKGVYSPKKSEVTANVKQTASGGSVAAIVLAAVFAVGVFGYSYRKGYNNVKPTASKIVQSVRS